MTIQDYKKYIIPVIFTDKRTYIAEMRESGYCQYGYESKEEGLVAEITEQQQQKKLAGVNRKGYKKSNRAKSG